MVTIIITVVDDIINHVNGIVSYLVSCGYADSVPATTATIITIIITAIMTNTTDITTLVHPFILQGAS